MKVGYFHEQEEFQVWVLEGYERAHPGSEYRISFADLESYLCVFDSAFDSDNSGELGIDETDAIYDEFHQVVMRVLRAEVPGLRQFDQWLSLDYRDWPERITDAGSGTCIVPAHPTTT